MSLISWKNWKESSAATRAKKDVALGLKPLAAFASPFSHSTDPVSDEKIIKKLKKKKKHETAPNYSIDSFFGKAELSQKELDDEKAKADAKEIDLDKKIKTQEDKEKEEKRKESIDKNKKDKIQSKEDDKAQDEWIHLCGQLI